MEGRGFAGIVERPAVKPLIAAVEGYTLAGGCEVALGCDMIVASREARFGLPEPKRGLVAAGGGLLRLSQRIPFHIAMEIALTSDEYPAGRMAELGFVNRLADPTRPDPTRPDPGPGRGQGAGPQGRRERPAGARLHLQGLPGGPGPAAFAEKRKPVWKGE